MRNSLVLTQEIVISSIESFLSNKTRRSNSQFTRLSYEANVRKFLNFFDSYYQIIPAIDARKKLRMLSKARAEYRKKGMSADAQNMDPEIKRSEAQAELTEKPFFEQMKEGKIDPCKILDGYGAFLNSTRTKTGHTLKPKTQRDLIYTAKKFLQYLRIKIDPEDFRQFVAVPRRHRTIKKAITREDIQKLLRNSPPRLQTATLVATASGMRLGEIVQLKGSDVVFNVKTVDGKTVTQINIRAETTKTRTSRMTFLTSEASDALKVYLNRYFDWKDGNDVNTINDKYIFGGVSASKRPTEYSVRIAENSLQRMLLRVIKKTPDLQEKMENDRNKIHFHGFREYCKTKLSNTVGQDYSELILGHEEGMSGIYYALQDSEKAELYLKAEMVLTISDFSSVEKEQRILIKQNTELQRQIDDIKKQLSHSETLTS